ncbi:MAG TPA: phosphatase [Gammaproteobacteria bacterium]|jgi:HAD superfamily hydrolase (TIGR01509 family)|nr:phosphatase [Gammaproteobacteria bacterium]
MADLRALLFDVDGTLADTERDGHRVAFNRAFADAGVDWFWDEALYGKLLTVTGGKERLRYFIEQIDPEQARDPGLDTFVRELHQSKTRHYLDLLRQGHIPLRPGVARLLREAREAGLRLGIATTTTPENVTTLLSSAHGGAFVDWFEVIAAGDSVPSKKPAPDVYHLAMEQLGLCADACLALEDSHNGLRAATAAGLRTLVTVNAYTVDDDVSAAALVTDGLGEPDVAARVLRGNMAATCVDLGVLQQLHHA